MNSDTDEEIQTYAPFVNQGVGLTYALTGIIGIVGNAMAFRTFWRERRKSYLHLQLAVANIITLASVFVHAPSALRGTWLFSRGMCTFTGFQVFLGGFAEMTFTCAICAETCMAICHPSRYSKFTDKHFAILSAIVWVYCLILASLPFFGYNSYRQEVFGTSCGLDLRYRTPSNVSYVKFTLILTSLAGVAAVVCIVLSYLKKDSSETHSFDPLFNNTKITKVSVFLMAFLVLCSIPYGIRIVSFIVGTKSQWRFLGVEFSHLAVKFGCCIQPLAYFLSSPEFKGQALATVTGVTYDKKHD